MSLRSKRRWLYQLLSTSFWRKTKCELLRGQTLARVVNQLKMRKPCSGITLLRSPVGTFFCERKTAHNFVDMAVIECFSPLCSSSNNLQQLTFVSPMRSHKQTHVYRTLPFKMSVSAQWEILTILGS